jgi:translation elongation factor EF-1alpha
MAISKDKLNTICQFFSKEYGELLLLKANIVAINKVLSEIGYEQKLYNEIITTMSNFRKKERTTDIIE